MNVSHEVLHSKITDQLCKAARTTSPEFSSVAAAEKYMSIFKSSARVEFWEIYKNKLNFERFIKIRRLFQFPCCSKPVLIGDHISLSTINLTIAAIKCKWILFQNATLFFQCLNVDFAYFLSFFLLCKYDFSVYKLRFVEVIPWYSCPSWEMNECVRANCVQTSHTPHPVPSSKFRLHTNN